MFLVTLLVMHRYMVGNNRTRYTVAGVVSLFCLSDDVKWRASFMFLMTLLVMYRCMVCNNRTRYTLAGVVSLFACLMISNGELVLRF